MKVLFADEETVIVTPEELKEAQENGISRTLLYNRLNKGWDKSEAIYQEKHMQRDCAWNEWQHVAEDHGVSKQNFLRRTTRKGSRFHKNYELAAKTPPRGKK